MAIFTGIVKYIFKDPDNASGDIIFHGEEKEVDGEVKGEGYFLVRPLPQDYKKIMDTTDFDENFEIKIYGARGEELVDTDNYRIPPIRRQSVSINTKVRNAYSAAVNQQEDQRAEEEQRLAEEQEQQYDEDIAAGRDPVRRGVVSGEKETEIAPKNPRSPEEVEAIQREMERAAAEYRGGRVHQPRERGLRIVPDGQKLWRVVNPEFYTPKSESKASPAEVPVPLHLPPSMMQGESMAEQPSSSSSSRSSSSSNMPQYPHPPEVPSEDSTTESSLSSMSLLEKPLERVPLNELHVSIFPPTDPHPGPDPGQEHSKAGEGESPENSYLGRPSRQSEFPDSDPENPSHAGSEADEEDLRGRADSEFGPHAAGHASGSEDGSQQDEEHKGEHKRRA